MKRAVAALLVLLGGGCATTSVTDSWRTPAPSPLDPMQELLVVAVVPNEATRQRLEQSLAAELRTEGVQAVPSYQVLPRSVSPSQDVVAQVLGETRYDGVLVSQFAGVDSDYFHDPGYGYWGWSTPRAGYYAPGPWGWGYSSVFDDFLMETSVFDARRDGELIWTATTRSADLDPASNEFPKIAHALVERLEEDRVLAAAPR